MSEIAITAEFIARHKQDPENQRLGQHFCNLYINGSFPELFYANDDKARRIIIQWLKDHQYTTKLPPKLEDD